MFTWELSLPAFSSRWATGQLGEWDDWATIQRMSDNTPVPMLPPSPYHRSKWKYSTAIYIFATLTIYMMVAAVLCAVRAVTNLDNVMFVRMIISVLSTYGVYVISSIIAFDPFHIVTCFLQYILLQASEWALRGSAVRECLLTTGVRCSQMTAYINVVS
jgi:hypothetical protein